jgi:hypothetical protein
MAALKSQATEKAPSPGPAAAKTVSAAKHLEPIRLSAQRQMTAQGRKRSSSSSRKPDVPGRPAPRTGSRRPQGPLRVESGR